MSVEPVRRKAGKKAFGKLKGYILQQASAKETGAQIQEAKIAEMRQSLSTFKEKLEEFARKHKKEINKDPAFRAQFNDMCLKIGVDPLASNKGFWADILGVGDFYYELSVQIVTVCLQTRNVNGGLIDIYELSHKVQEKRSKQSSAVSLDDIKQAISKVKSLGNGFGLITVGDKTMVKSVPVELNRDHSAILGVCSNTACTTVPDIKKNLGWPEHRIKEVLELMLQEGMVWTDDQNDQGKETLYWIPSLWNANASQDSS
ncbi:vacuolar-sorting protein [Reticulomyxa filosa]|uniref:Vacuolar-sorting protein n=1 Tax=Reticulomyxa filosa TaxID=46433 RepID=X6NTZ8_RETFI|nr:vacuolar-sorting protein [Reticulomyxa filosa]|eukprot:ETO29770.1 vacuolar-sorting protein [Reticulomyxa filosa]